MAPVCSLLNVSLTHSRPLGKYTIAKCLAQSGRYGLQLDVEQRNQMSKGSMRTVHANSARRADQAMRMATSTG